MFEILTNPGTLHKNQLYLFSDYYLMLPKNIIILPASDPESEQSSSIQLELKECIGKGELWMAKDAKTGSTRPVFITRSQEELSAEDADSDISVIKEDPQFGQLVDLCVKNKKVSVSLLQAELNIGYGRAKTLLRRLENCGYIILEKGRSLIFEESE